MLGIKHFSADPAEHILPEHYVENKEKTPVLEEIDMLQMEVCCGVFYTYTMFPSVSPFLLFKSVLKLYK